MRLGASHVPTPTVNLPVCLASRETALSPGSEATPQCLRPPPVVGMFVLPLPLFCPELGSAGTVLLAGMYAVGQ